MRVPLMNVDEIPEHGAVMVKLFGHKVLLFKAHGRPEALLDICATVDDQAEVENVGQPTRLSAVGLGRGHDRIFEDPLCPDTQLILLPTLVENGMLTYVDGE